MPNIDIGYTDVQVYTTGTGNWTKPAWATLVRCICIGGGGGGGGWQPYYEYPDWATRLLTLNANR